MEKLAGGNWISVKERNPVMYGKYHVECMQKGKMVEDDYLWNGSYWVTPKGSPSKGVEYWFEETVPEEAAEEEKAAVPAVPQERQLSLADYEARIYLYKEQIGTGYIGIGRTLIEAKEAKVVPHGQWEDWVTRTTGLTPRQAQRCMQAATEIRDGSAMARLEMSKALLLLSSGLDEETREEIAEKAADEGATVKDLREQLKQAKLKLMQETGAAMEIREELKRTESERASLQNQIKATIQGYQDRMAEVEDEAYRRGMKDGDSELRQMLRNREDRIRELNKEAREKLQEAKQETERAHGRASERAERESAVRRGAAEGSGGTESADPGERGKDRGAEDTDPGRRAGRLCGGPGDPAGGGGQRGSQGGERGGGAGSAEGRGSRAAGSGVEGPEEGDRHLHGGLRAAGG